MAVDATVMESAPYHCAILQMAVGKYFININRRLRDSLGLILSQEVKLCLPIDESQDGLPVFEKFEEVLRRGPETDQFFQSRSSGRQRTFIYAANNVKSSNIKLRRVLVAMEHLKLKDGKMDLKGLGEEFKVASRRENLN